MPPIRNSHGPTGCRKDGHGIWTAIEICHDPIENARNRKKRLTKLSDRRADTYGQWRIDNDHLDQGRKMNCICGKPNEKCVVLKNAVDCCIYIGRTCIRYFPGVRHATQTNQGYTRDGFVVDDDPSDASDEDQSSDDYQDDDQSSASDDDQSSASDDEQLSASDDDQSSASDDDQSSASDDDQSSASDLYIVDSITAHKKIDKVSHYRVHWLGYPTNQDTWEPASSFTKNNILLRAYQKAHLIKN
jgi:hypothetical protein